MGIKFRSLRLNHCYRNIGTVRCDSFQIRQQIIKRKSLPEFTFSFPQSGYMPVFEIIAQNSDQFPQRLDFCSHLQIILAESINCQIDNLLTAASSTESSFCADSENVIFFSEISFATLEILTA